MDLPSSITQIGFKSSKIFPTSPSSATIGHFGLVYTRHTVLTVTRRRKVVSTREHRLIAWHRNIERPQIITLKWIMQKSWEISMLLVCLRLKKYNFSGQTDRNPIVIINFLAIFTRGLLCLEMLASYFYAFDIKYLSAFLWKFKYFQIFWRFCYCNANFTGDFRKISKYIKLFNKIDKGTY